MKWNFYILLLCLVLYNFPIQGQEFFLSEKVEKKLEIEPEQSKVLFYNLVGSSTDFYEMDLEVILPEYWQLITATKHGRLRIGEHIQAICTFKASSLSAAGMYEIKILLKEKGLVKKEFQIPIEVLESRNLKLEILQKPEILIDAKEVRIVYTLKNLGNKEEKVTLSSSGSIDGKSIIPLGIGDTYSFSANYSIPTFLTNIDKISFDISAFCEGESRNYGMNFSIPYVNTKSKKSDPYHRFPLQVGIGQNFLQDGTNTYNSTFFDIRGIGYVDHDQKHQVELIARGPNQLDLPRFGNINQYYLSYEYKKYGKIELGDNNYNVSELLEANRFSRGLRASTSMGKWRASFMHALPRFFQDIQSETGVQVVYQFQEETSFGLNYMRKNHTINDNKFQTDFLSLTGQRNKSKYQWSGEVSLSKTGNSVSPAILNNLFINLEKLKVTSNFISTGSTFYGYYNNSLFVNHFISYAVNKTIRLAAFQNLTQINPSLDPIFMLAAPYSHNQGIEVGFNFLKKHQLRLNFSNGGREDRMKDKQFHFTETLARYFYDFTHRNLQIRLDGDYGSVSNLLVAEDQNRTGIQYRNRVNVRTQPVKNISLSGFTEHLRTNRFSTTLNQRDFLFFGFQGLVHMKKNLSINLFYRNSYAPDELYQAQSFFDLNVEYRKGKHGILATASYAYLPQTPNTKTLFANLQYTLQLNAPMHKKKNLGHMSGTISGVKTSGILLRLNGQSVLTDSLGKFSFYDLEPGSYYLTLDKQSLGFGNTIKQHVPLQVIIQPNLEEKMVLETLSTGKVSGKIASTRSNTKIPESIPVKISSQNYTKISRTNSHGEFSFYEIPEGEYTVSLLENELPEGWKTRQQAFGIEVKKGEETKASFELVKVEKKIEFIEQTIRLSDKK